MRPLSEHLRRILSCPTGYTVRGRVRVEGPGGTWYDLTRFFARDFLEDVTVDESLDAPVAQATVRVRREVHGLSLAPGMETSRANLLSGGYSPLLDPGRLFRVEAGIAPSDREPGPSDWLPLFLGRMDTPDAAGDVISFTGRDLAGVLQDVWIDEEKVYGSDAGTPLQAVCQSLLMDAKLGSSFPLYTPVDPVMMLRKYKQDVEPVYDALSKLATARAWEVRQKLRPDTGDWGLWLWGPDRTGATLAWTYGPTAYRELGEYSSSLEDVRTAVEVVYSDSADLDVAGQPKRKLVRRESAAALARYGFLNADGQRLHRFCRIAEGATSPINTAAEAERLADTALSDLSSASVGALVEVAMHPGLELGDMVQLAANGKHVSTAQTLAVRQVTHTLTSGSGRTKLALRGKPSLSERVWLDMEARGGIAHPAPFTGPAAPSGLAVTNSVAGAVLLFTAPSVASGGPEADSFELHVGTSPGFALSSATLREVSSSTCFDVTGLAAGGSYYARVRSRDRKGNVGPASDEVALAPRYVSPGLLEPRVSYAIEPLNSDFESQSDASRPPDAWSVTGTWGTVAAVTTDNYTGSRALQLKAPGAQARSSLRSVRPGDRYFVDAMVKATSNAFPQMAFEWLDAGLAVVDTWDFLIESAGPYLTYARRYSVAMAPSTARFVRVVLGNSVASHVSGSVTWDSVRIGEASLVQPAPTALSNITSFTNGWQNYTGGGRSGVTYQLESTGYLTFQGAMAPGTQGVTAFTAPYSCGTVLDFDVRTSAGTAWVAVTGSAISVQTGAVGATWVSLSGVRFRVT